MEYQHNSSKTDTGNAASDSPSEQDKTKELEDKPEMLQEGKRWLLLNKRQQSLKKNQKAVSAENIRRYLTNLSSHHSLARGEPGKAFFRKSDRTFRLSQKHT